MFKLDKILYQMMMEVKFSQNVSWNWKMFFFYKSARTFENILHNIVKVVYKWMYLIGTQ